MVSACTAIVPAEAAVLVALAAVPVASRCSVRGSRPQRHLPAVHPRADLARQLSDGGHQLREVRRVRLDREQMAEAVAVNR